MSFVQPELELEQESVADQQHAVLSADEMLDCLATFDGFGTKTIVEEFVSEGSSRTLPVFANEFWTSKQRAGSRLHEVSYRACFKPQLPLFFIERLTQPQDVVYDPFMGRGTTLLESALNGRIAFGTDINPLSRILVQPRLEPPRFSDVVERLKSIKLEGKIDVWEELLVFYHEKTLNQIAHLKKYFLEREKSNTYDVVDSWIRMVATNRLTGHSSGFFSVYSLPPNQAVSIKSQTRINSKRNQTPPERNIKDIIQKKSKSLLKLLDEEIRQLDGVAGRHKIITGSCDNTPDIADETVSLVVTSPPFLDEVDYETDNWLRCWFNDIDSASLPIWILRKPEQWQQHMTRVFIELHRILKPGGFVAFEVGEVRKGRIKLEDYVVPAGEEAGLTPLGIMLNVQEFTKTSNCWGVDNSKKGTNSNRIILFQK